MKDGRPATEEILRAVLRSMGEGVLVWSATDRVLLTWNDAAERILGISWDELEGRTRMDPAWQLLGEDGSPLPESERLSLAALRTEHAPPSTVIGIQRPDGTRAWVRRWSAPLRESPEAAPYATVTTLADVTELREAIARLKVANRLAEAAAGANVGTWELDLITGRAERNARWAGILGYAPAEIEPTLSAFTGRIHPEEKAECLATMQAGFATGAPFVFECRVMHKDGRWNWVQVRGKVAERTADGKSRRVAGMLVDIDARRRTEETLRSALAENERLVGELRTALESLRTVEGLLPICMYCKSIRDDSGGWSSVEAYVATHSKASFSHGICPTCFVKHVGVDAG